jgi:eukaryotic-like serine/threonine-protein kinase
MAELYLARATGIEGFEKLVALKRILPAHANDGDFIRMFLDEARLAATLRHPAIAQVFEIAHVDGEYFFTMEYIAGQNLRRVLRSGGKSGLALEHALGITLQLASALHHAHTRGIVHRDVSPSNVLVSYDGAVKLVDFGIAKASSSHAVTRAGTVKGNLVYMSPEQCAGLAVDGRSDIFSLGLVLHELLTGERPFGGESPIAIAHQIATKDVPSAKRFVPELPDVLDQILAKALARVAADRFPTAEDFQLALEHACRVLGVAPSPFALGRTMRRMFPVEASRASMVEPHASGEAEEAAEAAESTATLSAPIDVVATPAERSAPAIRRTGGRAAAATALAVVVIAALGVRAGGRTHVAAAATPSSEPVPITLTDPEPAPTNAAAPPASSAPSLAHAATVLRPRAPAKRPSKATTAAVDDPDAPLPATRSPAPARTASPRRATGDGALP